MQAKGSDYVPLSMRPVAMLRMQAGEYRRMAATARMAETRNSLLKLADRIDTLADQRQREINRDGCQQRRRADLPPDQRHGGR